MNLSFYKVDTIPSSGLIEGSVYFETSTGILHIAISSTETESYSGIVDAKYENHVITLYASNKEPIIIDFTDIDTDIQNEINRAIEAENKLQENINKAKSELSQAITAETTRAEEVEEQIRKELTSSGTELQKDITAETNRAKAAESKLQEAINAEKTRAEDAESKIENNLSKEIERATKAETNIQNQIDESIKIINIDYHGVEKTISEEEYNKVTDQTCAGIILYLDDVNGNVPLYKIKETETIVEEVVPLAISNDSNKICFIGTTWNGHDLWKIWAYIDTTTKTISKAYNWKQDLNFDDSLSTNSDRVVKNKIVATAINKLNNTTISAGKGLTGGGNLTTNRTISHGSKPSTGDSTGVNNNYISDIKIDEFGHIADVTTTPLENISGNASTADKLKTARSVTFEQGTGNIDDVGDVTGTFNFDGSENVVTKLKVIDDSHRHSNDTITSIDASKITTGIISKDRLPNIAISSFKEFATRQEALKAVQAGTTTQGDVVKITEDSGNLYYVKTSTGSDFDTVFEPFRAGEASSAPWDGVTDKPETATRWPKFTEVTNKPTSLSGYGINDGVNAVTPTSKTNYKYVTHASVNGHQLTLETGEVTVSDSNPTLDWGKKSQIGTIDGKALSVTMPTNPNSDTKVTSADNHYAPTANDYTPTNGSAVDWGNKVITSIEKDDKGHIVNVTTGTIPDNPNTDTKVTSVGNHYKSSITKTDNTNNVDITNNAKKVVTGVEYDEAGHITKVVTDPIYSTGGSSEGSSYTLPIADENTLGGVKSTKTGETPDRFYDVEVRVDGTMKVNVPWTDTNTKVTSVTNHYKPIDGVVTKEASAGQSVDITGTTGVKDVVTGVIVDEAGHVTGVTSSKLYSTDSKTTVENSLESDSVNNALSAAKGKELKEEIDKLNESQKRSVAITFEGSNFNNTFSVIGSECKLRELSKDGSNTIVKDFTPEEFVSYISNIKNTTIFYIKIAENNWINVNPIDCYYYSETQQTNNVTAVGYTFRFNPSVTDMSVTTMSDTTDSWCEFTVKIPKTATSWSEITATGAKSLTKDKITTALGSNLKKNVGEVIFRVSALNNNRYTIYGYNGYIKTYGLDGTLESTSSLGPSAFTTLFDNLEKHFYITSSLSGFEFDSIELIPINSIINRNEATNLITSAQYTFRFNPKLIGSPTGDNSEDSWYEFSVNITSGAWSWTGVISYASKSLTKERIENVTGTLVNSVMINGSKKTPNANGLIDLGTIASEGSTTVTGLTKDQADEYYQPKGNYLTTTDANNNYQSKGDYLNYKDYNSDIDEAKGGFKHLYKYYACHYSLLINIESSGARINSFIKIENNEARPCTPSDFVNDVLYGSVKPKVFVEVLRYLSTSTTNYTDEMYSDTVVVSITRQNINPTYVTLSFRDVDNKRYKIDIRLDSVPSTWQQLTVSSN